MELTGKLKEEVSSAETMEEKKEIIAQAGMKLTDDELVSVAGGGKQRAIMCKECGHCYFPTGFKTYCPACGGYNY